MLWEPLRDQFFYLHSAVLQSAAAILALSLTILLSLDQRRKENLFRIEKDLSKRLTRFKVGEESSNKEELEKLIPKWRKELENPNHISKDKTRDILHTSNEYLLYAKASYFDQMLKPVLSLVAVIVASTICLLFPRIQNVSSIGLLLNLVIVALFLYSIVRIALIFIRVVTTRK